MKQARKSQKVLVWREHFPLSYEANFWSSVVLLYRGTNKGGLSTENCDIVVSPHSGHIKFEGTHARPKKGTPIRVFFCTFPSPNRSKLTRLHIKFHGLSLNNNADLVIAVGRKITYTWHSNKFVHFFNGRNIKMVLFFLHFGRLHS